VNVFVSGLQQDVFAVASQVWRAGKHYNTTTLDAVAMGNA
jgi:hypothetical protein